MDDPPAGEASPDPADAAHSNKETTTGTRDRPGSDGDAGVTTDEAAETATGDQAETVASKVWPVVIALAIPGWLVVLFGVDVIPSPLWGIGFLVVWAVLPVALFLDARTLRDTGGWPQYWWVYVLSSVLWVVAIIPAAVYLWRRRTHRSRTASEQAELSER